MTKGSDAQRMLVTEREASHMFGLSQSWFQKRRKEGNGPKWIQIGTGVVRYDLAELTRWFGEHTQSAAQGE